MKYFYPIYLKVNLTNSNQVLSFKMSVIKNISLFVPHIFPNFNQKYVAESFTDIGDVERVDFVAKVDRDGKLFNSAYIHFKKWYDNRVSINTLNDIERNGNAKFYHDDSQYYWIVLPNTAKKHVPGERKSRIDLGESKYISVNKKPEKSVLKHDERDVYATPHYSKKLVSHYDVDEFAEFDAQASEEAEQMSEIEAELEAEEQYLVHIDSRYIQALEQENMMLHGEIAHLKMALIKLEQMYQAEAAKVTTFTSNVETSTEL